MPVQRGPLSGLGSIEATVVAIERGALCEALGGDDVRLSFVELERQSITIRLREIAVAGQALDRGFFEKCHSCGSLFSGHGELREGFG